MGNQASSVQIHALLTAEDIKALRDNFPGGGHGPLPPSLDWGAWGDAWAGVHLRERLQAMLRPDKGLEGPKEITFHAYQELAGCTLRGPPEERIKLLFRLLHRPVDKMIKLAEFVQFLRDIVRVAGRLAEADGSRGKRMAQSTVDEESTDIFAQTLIKELTLPGESNKASLHKDLCSDPDMDMDFDILERWLVMKCPLFEQLYLYVLAKSFGMSMDTCNAGINKPFLLPLEPPVLGSNTSLNVYELIFFTQRLPADLRKKWRPLFNSKLQGESFSKFSSAILNRGPTLIIVWEKNGHKFGGYSSTSWSLGPKFQGDANCFLFSLSPKMLTYETTTFNNNFMYMNLKQKTMPNGLGMGGKLEYFGLWLSDEYGHGRCAPSCTSFQSPQLSKEEHFEYVHLEAWGLGAEPEDEDGDLDGAGGGGGVRNADPEVRAVMEMMGKTFAADAVLAEDEQMEKEKKDGERRKEQK